MEAFNGGDDGEWLEERRSYQPLEARFGLGGEDELGAQNSDGYVLVLVLDRH